MRGGGVDMDSLLCEGGVAGRDREPFRLSACEDGRALRVRALVPHPDHREGDIHVVHEAHLSKRVLTTSSSNFEQQPHQRQEVQTWGRHNAHLLLANRRLVERTKLVAAALCAPGHSSRQMLRETEGCSCWAKQERAEGCGKKEVVHAYGMRSSDGEPSTCQVGSSQSSSQKISSKKKIITSKSDEHTAGTNHG